MGHFIMNGELYHWGIKGMRWGVRRFQNKDGSLTPAGKKRYADDSPEESSEKYNPSYRSKSVKDMTDDELAAAIRRSEMEKRYRDLNPQQVSRGRKFFDEAILPAATQVTKSLLQDYVVKKGKKYLGLKDDNPTDAIKKEIERLKLNKELKDLADTEFDKLKKESERAKFEQIIRNNKKQADADAAERAKAEAEAKKSEDSKAHPWTKEDDVIDVDFTEVRESTSLIPRKKKRR